jgi:hypothetical protein
LESLLPHGLCVDMGVPLRERRALRDEPEAVLTVVQRLALQRPGGVETVANGSARQVYASNGIIQRLEAIHKMV